MSQSSWLSVTEQQTLSPGFPERMVLLDVETTGGRASYHRVIEIGLWVVEDGRLVDSWQTFINPERSLPPKITELTGITRHHLLDAPTFADIADELWQWLQNRVLNHFSQDHSQRKDFKLHKQIAHLDYQRTPSDFGACLLENQEIKKHLPVHNIRLRRVKKMFQICLQDGQHAIQKIHIKAVASDQVPNNNQQQFGLFRTVRQASEYLRYLADEHHLCHRVLGLESGVAGSQNPCFRFQLKRCAGACCGQESLQQHTNRLRQALAETQIQDWPWPSAILLVEQDINDPSMTWLHLIDGWVYIAALTTVDEVTDHGFRSETQIVVNMTSVAANNPIQSCGFNLDVYHILSRFLNNPKIDSGLQKLTIVPLTAVH